MNSEPTPFSRSPVHAPPSTFGNPLKKPVQTPAYPTGADRTDVRILRALQRNGRLSYQRLGEMVHLSPTAVFERVKRLERNGFILGYEARLDPTKLGVGTVVYIEVRLERTQADAMQRFNDAVRSCPDILECHLVAGDFDYLLKARVAANNDFPDHLPPSFTSLPGVRTMRSYSVKSGIKEDAKPNF